MNYLQVKLDAETKDQAEAVFKELGLSMSDAVRMFFKQVIIRKEIPFKVSIVPDTTRADMLMDASRVFGISSTDSEPDIIRTDAALKPYIK